MYPQGQLDFKKQKYQLAKKSLTSTSNQSELPIKNYEKQPVHSPSMVGPPQEQEEDEKNHKDINKLVDDTSKVLFYCKAVFPFDFFPDELVIDTEKVSFINHEFFYSEVTHSVYIKDIDTMHTECGPFFATLKISHGGYQGNNLDINYLTKKDAKEARRIIEGLIITHKKGVDFAGESQQKVKEKAEDIGRIHAIE